MSDIDATLQERGSRYGDFTDHARISVALQRLVFDQIGQKEVPPFVEEGISMICHKLARVANGDPLYADNFVDIAGYAKLVADRLEANQP